MAKQKQEQEQEQVAKGYKLLIAGDSNSGKTSLTKNLKNTLVISHDGKAYPFKVPHGTIKEINTTAELTTFVNEKVDAYIERYGSMPENIVFDSVSRIYDSLYDACNKRYTGFNIYSNLDKEIKEFADFLEQILEVGVNLIIISHSIADADTGKTNLVGKGSFAKLGGFLSVVDEAIYIQTKKNDKRELHFRSTVYPARTLQDDLPNTIAVEDFDLQTHVERLSDAAKGSLEFSL